MLYCKNGCSHPSGGATSPAEFPWIAGGVFEHSGFLPDPALTGAPTTLSRPSGLRTPGDHAGGRRAFLHRQRLLPCNSRVPKSSIRCLQEEGVEYVFGYPGGAVLNIYDELFKQDKVKHVLVRHEQGAVHAADGYRARRLKVGVALVTSGPGVTNAVTGIATAYMDSIPMVVITGQVPTHAIGQDAFQECDTVGITRPVREAQLPREGRQGHRDDDQEGVLHRGDRAARPGAGRHPEGRPQAHGASTLSEDRLAALVQPGDQGPRRPDQEGGRSCCSTRSGR